jgi:hypothetical protein
MKFLRPQIRYISCNDEDIIGAYHNPHPPVLLNFETWPSLRLRPKKMAGFTVSNVFSNAGSDPNMKIDLLYLFIKRGILSFYKHNKLVN